MPSRLVLVTGATGFLGSALLPLLLARGFEVHAFARPQARRAHLPAERVTWHAGDLAVAASIAPAVEAAFTRARELGARLDVVHAGAVISYRRRDGQQAHAVNVVATRALLEALQRGAHTLLNAGRLGRLCHVSSVVSVGWTRTPERVLDEDSPFPSEDLRCHYVSTKRASELDVLAAADALDVVVVNPGAIFGVSPVGSNTKRLLAELARRGGVPFSPPGSLAAVGLDDVADGCLLALERGRRGERYLLTESHWKHLDLQTEVARQLGVRPPRRAVPVLAWRLLERAVSAVDRVSPRTDLTPAALRHLGVHYNLGAARARSELGWTPEPFAAVLARALGALSEFGA